MTLSLCDSESDADDDHGRTMAWHGMAWQGKEGMGHGSLISTT